MSKTEPEEIKNEPNEPGRKGPELVKKAAIFSAGALVGLGIFKIFNSQKLTPDDLIGKDLPTKIESLMKLNLSNAGEDQMRLWSSYMYPIWDEIFKALAEKYQLKKKEPKPKQVIKHLSDKKLIGEELRDKLYHVVDCRNKMVHEESTVDMLRGYFRQFDDVLPVLRERL
ncbi:hypothetical protein P0082_08870 [Candidatus Haliotispira prima]|uniref:DUF4145 domain-containing protein n=1 Tax=Candidatus Haliotispira prima TaxID=3034016 RepID=A0ABY8MIF2_9SPIO|nr:hypothetical protein P0082_08870 [Candidatus Haliotispira prima]